MQKTIYVSSDTAKQPCFPCIQDALDSIADDNTKPHIIKIAPGTYSEKLVINKPFVTLEGTGNSSKDTVLTFHDYAEFVMEDGRKRGTFRSYSVFIDTHDVTLKNLTIENSSGDARVHGQAIALYADGDRLIIDSCRLLGHQDTLFTGPLPPKEIEPNGFIGPKQFAPRVNGRQYYKNCFIAGNIDFIFGSAAAFFEACTIESLPYSSNGTQGYITAASTPQGQAYGYVFYKCRLVSKECPPGTVYLGRPWRDFAKTVFVQCEFGAHIHPQLFHDWNKLDARKSVFYAVGQNSMAGCSSRSLEQSFTKKADFVQELNETEAAAFSKTRVLSGSDGWMP